VVGSAGGGAFFILFAVLIIRKITKAITKKSKMDCRKAPHLITASPSVNVTSLRLMPPMSNPMIGVRISPTKDVTIFPKAPPMMTAMARSNIYD
jgi:hypothetical protein